MHRVQRKPVCVVTRCDSRLHVSERGRPGGSCRPIDVLEGRWPGRWAVAPPARVAQPRWSLTVGRGLLYIYIKRII